MATTSFDTTAQAHEVQLGVYRRLGPERRAETAVDLSESVRRLATDGIRRRHPDYTDGDVVRALVVLLYGRGVAECVWPGVELPAP